jgi:hypothetical protein
MCSERTVEIDRVLWRQLEVADESTSSSGKAASSAVPTLRQPSRAHPRAHVYG